MKEEIGFKHGIPESKDRTWDKEIGGRTFVFEKRWDKKQKQFLYRCVRGGTNASFYSSRELTLEDLEQSRQFYSVLPRR